MAYNPQFLVGWLALGIARARARAVESINTNLLVAQVEEIRKTSGIPTVAFGVVKDGEIVFSGALGVRRPDAGDMVATQDHFHIGSNTKAVTAFIAARLVDQHKLSWDTRFFALFPELETNANRGYHDMTLRALLSHRTGLPSFKDGNQWATIKQARDQFHPANGSELKLAAIRFALQQTPAALTKDEPSHYSNLGYLFAAQMLEHASGKSYEELVRQLNGGLKVDFRIGGPESIGNDQPRGNVIPIKKGLGESSALGLLPKEIEEWPLWNDWVFLCRPVCDLCVSATDFLHFLDFTLSGRLDREPRRILK